MRPEYEDLKDEIERLGGADRVREVLATEEDLKRQPFLQAKRLIAVSAPRVVSDAIFRSLRFDALVADEAPRIPLPLLIACACMARERIILAGDPQDIPPPASTPYGVSLGWCVELQARPVSPAGTSPA
jgi:hypothetical protein